MTNLNLFYSIFGNLKAPWAKVRPEQLTQGLKLAYKPAKIRIKEPAELNYRYNCYFDTFSFGKYPDYYLNDSKELLPHYEINYLHSYCKGAGTQAVRKVVQESVKNPKTQGRVTLIACTFDDKKFPCGFYKRLGFKSINEEDEKILNEWIKNGRATKGKYNILNGRNYKSCFRL